VDRSLAKFDADGDLEFAKVIRGLANFGRSFVTETAGGDLVVCSEEQPSIARTTTYFLTLDNARNAARDVTGVLLARLDEHGDIGPDGCAFGSLLPQRSCNDDPGCLRCLQRLVDGSYLETPRWRAELYHALRPFTRLPEGRVPVEAADVMRSALAKAPHNAPPQRSDRCCDTAVQPI
jgi:hypothetical protein